jgi:hypothetical protein
MALSIRDPNVEKLARRLAVSRGTNMTRAIEGALAEALENDRRYEAMPDRVMRLVRDFNKTYPPVRPPLTKEEIDKMWGQ